MIFPMLLAGRALPAFALGGCGVEEPDGLDTEEGLPPADFETALSASTERLRGTLHLSLAER